MNDKILKIENELYNDLNNYILMLKDLENKTNGTDIDILIEKDKETAFYLISAQTTVNVLQGVLDKIKNIKEQNN